MLPTPDTSHVAFERVYEPAEDSYLLLDTLSSESETAFLRSRFGGNRADATTTPTAAGTVPAPFVVEIGPGSGVVIGFVNAHASHIFGSSEVLTAAIDVNRYACAATRETVRKAAADVASSSPSTSPTATTSSSKSGTFLGAMQGDLTAPLRDGSVDVLIFNPPYVPTEELPRQPTATDMVTSGAAPTFQDDSYLLSLSYAGGADGMEITDLLIGRLGEVLAPRRGCAYVLLCAQNKPEAVKQRVRGFGPEWRAETVGSSGKQAGWEKLQIVRIWREEEQESS
ncbi:methyltransferase [Apiospora hydei]|uniref:Methyltransferase n=1 Tax=Apiospora hydei TaxID=1337664 RepID=A0ABR1X159_9PEZI